MLDYRNSKEELVLEEVREWRKINVLQKKKTFLGKINIVISALLTEEIVKNQINSSRSKSTHKSKGILREVR